MINYSANNGRHRTQRVGAVLFRLFGITCFVACIAAIPLPDVIYYGELRINGSLIPASRTDVSVYARIDGSTTREVARYRMGDRAQVLDRYALRVKMESGADGSPPSQNAARVNDRIDIFVQVDGGPEQPVEAGADLLLTGSGIVTQLGLSVGAPCFGDIDGDHAVTIQDLANLLSAYASCPGDPTYNPLANLDPVQPCIDIGDLAQLLSHFASPCP